MDDKIEEILAQYPVQIESRKRIRGAIEGWQIDGIGT